MLTVEVIEDGRQVKVKLIALDEEGRVKLRRILNNQKRLTFTDSEGEGDSLTSLTYFTVWEK